MPKRRSSQSTDVAEKRRRKLMIQLASNLTPQMISPTQNSNGPRSRFGRKIFTSPIVSAAPPPVNKRKVYTISTIHTDKLNPLLRLVSNYPTPIDSTPIAKLLYKNIKQLHNRLQDNEQASSTMNNSQNDVGVASAHNSSIDSAQIDSDPSDIDNDIPSFHIPNVALPVIANKSNQNNNTIINNNNNNNNNNKHNNNNTTNNNTNNNSNTNDDDDNDETDVDGFIIDLTSDDHNKSDVSAMEKSQTKSLDSIACSDAGDSVECAAETTHSTDASNAQTIALEISLIDNKSQADGIGCNSGELSTSIDTSGVELENASNCADSRWRAGDLVWAALSSYPFWPAIVAQPEADERHLLNEDKVNVVFLYDNGRRAWITKRNCVMPYAGLDDYRKICELPENRRNKAYKLSKNKSWDLAVLEADILVHINGSDRPAFYKAVLLDAVQMTNRKLKNHRRSGKGRCYTPQTSDTAYSSIKQSSSRTSLSPPLNDIDNFDVQKNVALYLASVEDMNIDPIEVDSIEPPALESLSMASMFNCPLTESIDDRLSAHPGHSESIHCRNEFRKALWAMCKQLTKPINDCVASTMQLSLKRKRTMSTESKGSNNSDGSAAAAVKQTKRQRLMVQEKQAKLERESERLSLTNEWQQQQQKVLEQRRESAKAERLRSDNEIIRKSNMDLHAANYLFKNVPKEAVCQVCYEEGELYQCLGPCCGFYHENCMTISCTEEMVMNRLRSRKKSKATFRESIFCNGGGGGGDGGGGGGGGGSGATARNGMCEDCNAKETVKCFICNKDDVDSMQCSEKNCTRSYHEKCLKKAFPQYKVSYNNKLRKLTCPRHVCHTCVSSDVKNLFQKPESDRKLIKCLLCPGTYHRTSKCLPAGSEIVSEEQMICGRHHLHKGTQRVNVDFCMLCSKTGELVCCDTCPHAFHEACLKIPVVDDTYLCEECESGKRPLYGEVVWVRFAKASWWPGIIVPAPMVPERVQVADKEPQYFCVFYFGTHNFGWVGQSQVYSYQEGDAAYKLKNEKKKLEAAIDEAEQCIKQKREQEYKKRPSAVHALKPKPYRKIKTNRITAKFVQADDNEKENICSCEASDASPCGIDSNCVNQLLFVECDPLTCPTKDKCQNQCFKNGPRYEFEIKFTGERGFGLYAKDKIPENAFIVEYVGEVIDQGEFHVRFERAKANKEDNFYFLILGNSFYIDAGPYGNDARFINHSCEPNAAPKKWNVDGQTRIGFFAERDIQPGEEITFFYNWGIREQMCRCGSAKCRGFM